MGQFYSNSSIREFIFSGVRMFLSDSLLARTNTGLMNDFFWSFFFIQ